MGDHTKSVCLEPGGRRAGVRSYSRKREEFVADFTLVSRRFLDDFDYRIFRYFFLLGADWKLCCRQMKMDRGNFFHMVYRIEQILGRAFADLEPYGLYPLSDYFEGVLKKECGPALQVVPMRPRTEPRFTLPLSA